MERSRPWATTVMTRPIQWVFEADIRGFLDHLQHEWLMQMVGERIGDPGVLRLIAKWLHGPIVEPDGRRSRPTEGAPQGGPSVRCWEISTSTMC